MVLCCILRAWNLVQLVTYINDPSSFSAGGGGGAGVGGRWERGKRRGGRGGREEGGGVWLCQDKFYLIPLPFLAAVNLLYYPTLTSDGND